MGGRGPLVVLAAMMMVASVLRIPPTAASFGSTTAATSSFVSGTWYTPPAVVSTATWWLDAADMSTLFTTSACTTPTTGSGNVGCWVSKVGSNRKITGTSLPTRSTIPMGANRPLRFTPTASLGGADFFGGSTSNIHIFMVSKEVVRGDNYMFSLNGLTTDTGRFTIHAPWQGTWYFDAGGYTTNRVVGPSTLLGNPQVFSGYKDSATVKSSMRLKGGTSYYSTGNTAAPTTGGLVLGAGPATATIDVAEVIVFPSRLSPADETAVEQYLMTKWAI